MRKTGLTMLSVLLMICCCRMAAAEESSWGWLWPFGHEKASAQPYPSTSAASSTDRPARHNVDRATLRQSPGRRQVSKTEVPWTGIELPKPHLPQLWPGKSEVSEARNAWTEKKPEPKSASPWQVMTESTERLGASTSRAWHKTVDALTPSALSSDKRPAPHVAQREPIWKRAFGLGEKEPEGPQTVTEWMSQDRLNP
jgi:hypothetical protein